MNLEHVREVTRDHIFYDPIDGKCLEYANPPRHKKYISGHLEEELWGS